MAISETIKIVYLGLVLTFGIEDRGEEFALIYTVENSTQRVVDLNLQLEYEDYKREALRYSSPVRNLVIQNGKYYSGKVFPTESIKGIVVYKHIEGDRFTFMNRQFHFFAINKDGKWILDRVELIDKDS